jgi:ethanolamine ammonia-lyase small subunit
VTTAARDPWFELAGHTAARIALGRVGCSLPTREVLGFALAHAQARDAVHARFDRATLCAAIAGLGLATVEVASEAPDRQLYLRRPDLGRRLDASSKARLAETATRGCDLALVLADGLSALSVMAHAPALVAAFLPHARRLGLSIGPVAAAEGGRVALGDEIGVALGARIVAVLIGERPGLSASDSLGVYLTHEPRPGRTDAERNCLSNIRPEGLAPAAAAARLAWLVDAALTRKLSGVSLKDESDAALAGVVTPTPLGGPCG